jgi:multidrug efflux pump subunit AcrA (membrane-fusion protein)
MSNLDLQSQAHPPTLPATRSAEESAVMHVEADDFLPGLGGWTRAFGRNALIATTAGILGLAIWPWRETVRAAGVVRPDGENTVVQSQLDGTLAAVWIKENQEVKEGQALAMLDHRQLESEKRKLESELRESLAQQHSIAQQSTDLKQKSIATSELLQAQLQSAARNVDNADATLNFRHTELQRYRSLQATGAVAASVVDEKNAQYSLARNELAKARQALEEQRARGTAQLADLRQDSGQTLNQQREFNKLLETTRSRLAEVNRALSNSTIKAPQAGTILLSGMRHAQQVIRAGEILAQIAPTNAKQTIQVRIPSRDIGSVKPKQEAYLRVTGCPYPDYGVLKAKVINISADTVQKENDAEGSRTSAYPGLFRVSLEPASRRLHVGNRICELRHGMDVQAEIVTRKTTVLGFLFTKLRLFSGT